MSSTTREVTAFIGRTAEGDRIYAHLSVTTDDTREASTVGHERVTGTVRLSAFAFAIAKGRREAHAAGQMLEDLTEVTEYAAGWTRADVRSLLTLWRRWHLNDMRAGCAHMTLPDDKSYDARKDIACPVATVVTRDGKPVSPVLPNGDAAWKWLHDHQGMSVDWALRHEGYAFAPGYTYGQAWLYDAPPADVLAEWERLMSLPTGKVPDTY
jgi:hypothetical protein